MLIKARPSKPLQRGWADLTGRVGRLNLVSGILPRGAPMTFRIAVVQPIAHAPEGAEANVADAVNFIERAADEGADFVCFPETYPGPWRMPATFDPTPALAEAAVKHGVHAVFGTIEALDPAAATAHNLIVMAYPDGRAPARYRRTHPNGPWIYTGGPWWEFQYVAGDAFKPREISFLKGLPVI